jgi:hypothetical protein
MIRFPVGKSMLPNTLIILRVDQSELRVIKLVELIYVVSGGLIGVSVRVHRHYPAV